MIWVSVFRMELLRASRTRDAHDCLAILAWSLTGAEISVEKEHTAGDQTSANVSRATALRWTRQLSSQSAFGDHPESTVEITPKQVRRSENETRLKVHTTDG